MTAMRRVGAIFLLTLRCLVRSRFLAALAGVVFLFVAALPWTLRDDGTLAGLVQVRLRYTLGAVGFLLAAGTLAAAPGLVAGELESRRLQQVLVKPVRFGEIWLGKWLALAVVQAVLLGAAVLLADGLLRAGLRARGLTAEQAEIWRTRVRTARAVVPPAEPAFPAAALEARAALLRRTGEADESVSPGRVRRLAARRLAAERNSVPPGGVRRWTFPLPAGRDPGLPLALRVRLLTSGGPTRPDVAGEWRIGFPGDDDGPRVESRLRAVTPQEVALPAMAAPGATTLEVAYHNRESDVSVLFHPQAGIRLLAPAGGFGSNLFRAYLLMVFKLLLLAAVGVTLGSLLSTPVAVLTAFFALVLLGFSGYIGWVAETGLLVEPHHHGPAPDPAASPFPVRAAEAAVKTLYGGLERLLGPIRELDPMERVAAGERIGGGDVARGLLVLVGAGCGFWALLALLVFGRRETG